MIKNFIKTFAVVSLLMLFSFSATAQTPKNPNAVAFRVLFMDFQSLNGDETAMLSDISNGFELSYQRHLNDYLNVAAPIRFGIMDLPNTEDNKTLFGIDLLAQGKYYKEGNFVIPYAFAGGGYMIENMDNSYFQVPVGLGFNFIVWERAFINAQGAYRYSPTGDRNSLELGVGFVIGIGELSDDEKRKLARSKDTDEDGVNDMDDRCPLEPGPVELKGCPDTDGDKVPDNKDDCPNLPGPLNGCPDGDSDGVPDPDDDCPTEAGLVELKGCPPADSDGDGIPDDIDECPDAAGNLTTKGCPDADNDGVMDGEDDCPDEAGAAELNGCPDTDEDGVADRDDDCPSIAGSRDLNGCPDTDDDGIADPDDRCPTNAGPASNSGCPEIQQEEKEILNLAMRAVQFEVGKTTLLVDSYGVLDQIAGLLSKYTDYKLSIAGHTDDVGGTRLNQQLSEERAKACYEYFVSKGIDTERLSYAGFGESLPIDTNSTREGRRNNRRVEFNLYLD